MLLFFNKNFKLWVSAVQVWHVVIDVLSFDFLWTVHDSVKRVKRLLVEPHYAFSSNQQWHDQDSGIGGT